MPNSQSYILFNCSEFSEAVLSLICETIMTAIEIQILTEEELSKLSYDELYKICLNIDQVFNKYIQDKMYRLLTSDPRFMNFSTPTLDSYKTSSEDTRHMWHHEIIIEEFTDHEEDHLMKTFNDELFTFRDNPTIEKLHQYYELCFKLESEQRHRIISAIREKSAEKMHLRTENLKALDQITE